MILDKIVEKKKQEIKSLDKNMFKVIQKSKRDFKAHIKGKNNIIAEIKKASPSNSRLNRDIDIIKTTKIYNRYANAISVVTDKEFFGGDVKDIKIIKQHTSLPILRKDFIIEESQIYESRFYGADAILLIASILSKEQINKYIKIAKKLSMDLVVEVHSKEELDKVLSTDAEIIGINNRNLKNFVIDIRTTLRLKKHIPKDKLIISESGIESFQEVNDLNSNAVLIGTAILTSKNIKEKISKLRRPKIKICGITNIKDATAAVKLGADFLGFNFYKKSPRYISILKAKEIIKKLNNKIAIVGIFVNHNKKSVNRLANNIGIDFLQFHGDEKSNYCNSFDKPVIKATRIKDKVSNIEKYQIFSHLFDTYHKKLFGGTGKTFDINLIKNIQEKYFISGGLNHKNISNIKKQIDPYCFDVCSGIEKSPGLKDYNKMKKFIQEVRS